MKQFDFTVLQQSKKSRARLGLLKTPHGEIKTPAFVTVGTKGTVKSLTPVDLQSIGTQMVFVNTYHLVVSGALSVVERVGIHRFSNIQKPIITDSGGFQVFSLAQKLQSRPEGVIINAHPRGVHITDNGVEFRSPLDGTKYFFTPEFSIDAQRRIGSDLTMAFDECVSHGVSYEYTKKAMERTHRWVRRSLYFFNRKDNDGRDNSRVVPTINTVRQQIYGVIQGGCFEDLRKQSARFISSLSFFGLAIGGVSVGETKKEMRDQVSWVMEVLGDDPRPRHLLGVGELDDIFDTIAMGMDTMDCVIPTRHARMGRLYVVKSQKSIKSEKSKVQSLERYGEIDILNSQYKQDLAPIDKDCECHTCHHFTRAYLHHLFKQKELLAYRLATMHNLHFMEKLFGKIREMIEQGGF